MSTIKTKQTTDYDLFKFVLGNRKVSDASRRLMEKTLLKEFPVKVNKKMEIIDGQRRFLAAKNLGLPIYYEIADLNSLTDIQIINAAQKQWSLADYLRTYIYLGKEDYDICEGFVVQHEINLSSAINLLNGNFNSRNLRLFKEGEFEISEEEIANEVMSRAIIFKPYMNKFAYGSHAFIKAIFNLVKNGLIDWEIMKERMDNFEGGVFHRQPSTSDYTYQIERIYNQRKGPKTRIF